MTTFEITIIVLLVAIVVLLIVLLRTAIEGFHGVWQKLDAGVEQLCCIEVNTHHASSMLKDNIAPDVETLSNNFQYLLDGKKGIPALFDIVDKIHRNLCVETADKMVDKVYPPTYVPSKGIAVTFLKGKDGLWHSYTAYAEDVDCETMVKFSNCIGNAVDALNNGGGEK